MSCNELDLVKIGDICDVGSSKRIYASDYTESGIPFYRSKEVIELATNQEIINELFISKDKFNQLDEKFGSPKNGDILLASIGANMGIPYYVNTNYKFYFKDGNVTWFKNFKNNVNSKYIYYWIKSPLTQQKFINIAIGSAQKALTIDSLKKLDIYLPPLEEQEKIANILSSLDDKIELNNEMNKTLEEMAQSIFKRWFVDFEFPNEDGEPYKSSGGEMVDSELGMIPKGWEVVNYINTSDIQYGFAFKSKLFNDKEGKPIIRIRDISNSYTPTYTTEEYNDLYIVTKNDILVGMDGEFKAHIWGGKDSLLNQRVLRIRPKDNNSIAYSYFSIKEPLRYLENSKVGTTVIHLGKKDIDNIKIVYPPNNLISKYRDIADNLINKICENKVEIMELSELRDRLLPKLMIGEIKVN